MRPMMLLLCVLTMTSCVGAPKPVVIQNAPPPPPKLAAETFSCPAWPVVALLDAVDAKAALAVVHSQAEPAQQACACQLHGVAQALDRLGMLNGPLPAAPFGCEA